MPCLSGNAPLQRLPSTHPKKEGGMKEHLMIRRFRCQNRPEGMDVSTWCEQNNITKANYYYRLKRVRQMFLDQLPEAEKPAFVELPHLKAEGTATVPEVPVMCIKNGHGLSTDIFSSVSPQLLRCLVEVFSHVE